MLIALAPLWLVVTAGLLCLLLVVMAVQRLRSWRVPQRHRPEGSALVAEAVEDGGRTHEGALARRGQGAEQDVQSVTEPAAARPPGPRSRGRPGGVAQGLARARARGQRRPRTARVVPHGDESGVLRRTVSRRCASVCGATGARRPNWWGDLVRSRPTDACPWGSRPLPTDLSKRDVGTASMPPILRRLARASPLMPPVLSNCRAVTRPSRFSRRAAGWPKRPHIAARGAADSVVSPTT